MGPQEPGELDCEVFTGTAIAARLGVAVETLRTWDRRYGIGPTGAGGRGAGGRRRYREVDVARLLTMRRLVAAGVPTAEAARRARSEQAPPSPAPSGDTAAAQTSTVGTAAQRGLLRAATALDAATVNALLTAAIAEAGVQRCWDELLRPALDELGHRWEASGKGVETEHLVSQIAGDVLRAVVAPSALEGREAAGQPAALMRPTLLLAAVDGEQHVLALEALAALLRQQGKAVVLLGASTPAAALDAVVRRIRPSGIFLWARVEGPAVVEAARTMRAWPAARARRPLRIVVGGQGWSATHVPAGVQRAATLAEAAAALESP